MNPGSSEVRFLWEHVYVVCVTHPLVCICMYACVFMYECTCIRSSGIIGAPCLVKFSSAPTRPGSHESLSVRVQSL